MTNNEGEAQPLDPRSSSSSSSLNSSPLATQGPTAAPRRPPSSTAPIRYGALSRREDDDDASFDHRTTLPRDIIRGNDRRGGGGDIYGSRGDGPRGLPSEEEESAIVDAMEKDPAASFQNPLLYLATEEVTAFNPYEHPRPHPNTPDDEGGRRPPIEIAAVGSGSGNGKGDGGGGGPSDEKDRLRWAFRGRSPRFTRFGVLLLITLLPFGAHFVKNCFSSLQTYFLEDPKLHFNATKYGAVMSAISVPNLFMPFFGGLFLDAKGYKQGIILFLALELIGHVVFTLAMGWQHFWLAIVGQVIHGVGSGTVMVAMRTVVSKFFLEKELTFALGVTVAGACVSKTLAKASVAPIADSRWGYMGALWYVGLWQVLSLVAGLVYVRVADSAHFHVGMERTDVEHKDLRLRSLLVALRGSTLSFWLVAVLHTLFLSTYHLFSNYSGNFLFENYDVSAVVAGYISALMPLVVVFCAPLAGLFLDRYGRQLYVLLAASVFSTVAFVLLLEERAGAVFCIVMLALCESFVPTILLSALPLTVHPSVYGAAFGIAEVMSSMATIVANIFYGYSRDKTASYTQDLSLLVVMCIICLAITLFLTFWDARYGRSMLNRPSHMRDFKALH